MHRKRQRLRRGNLPGHKPPEMHLALLFLHSAFPPNLGLGSQAAPVCRLGVGRGPGYDVKRLIEDLRHATNTDLHFYNGLQFLPVTPDDSTKGSPEAGPSFHSRIRMLVALGPKAIPLLLEHLQDSRPTAVVVDARSFQPPTPDTGQGANVRRSCCFEYEPRVPIFDWSSQSGAKKLVSAPP